MSSNPVGRPRQFDEGAALDAAIEVFWHKGFEGTSLTDLCKATGLHKGSLYQAFGDKRCLFAKALQRYTEDRFILVTSLISDKVSPLTNLRIIATKVCELMEEDKGCLIVNSMTSAVDECDDVQAVLDGFYHKRYAAITEMITAAKQMGEIRPELDPEELAQEVMISLSGAGVIVKSPLGKEGTISAVQRIIDHWC